MQSAPKEKQRSELAMESEGFLLDEMEEISAEHIQVDAWGNEWDNNGDFMDMDFRLVED
ncbi:MAG: hypothetical protein JKY90_02200 [Gammaproteobacteria bacterium]|nr:hypothetical protein [Gammaproteobacteria bacterium]